MSLSIAAITVLVRYVDFSMLLKTRYTAVCKFPDRFHPDAFADILLVFSYSVFFFCIFLENVYFSNTLLRGNLEKISTF